MTTMAPPALRAGVPDDFPVVCAAATQISSSGIWLHDNPLNFAFPLLMMQITIVFISTRTVRFLLQPLRQPRIVADILGGLILGPSLLGMNKSFKDNFFPPKGAMVLNTVAMMSSSFFVFLIGVRTDLSMMKKSGKQAFGIAISGIVPPLVLLPLLTMVMWKFIPADLQRTAIIPSLCGMLAVSCFPVISCLLADLRILGSELGRLCISIAIISDICGMTMATVSVTLRIKARSPMIMVYAVASIIALALLCVVIFRPIALWVISKSREGQYVKDIYIFFFFVGVLITAFISESIGQQPVFGPFVLGLVIPDGPPLGDAILERLDAIISGVFFPLYFALVGFELNLFAIHDRKIVAVIALMFLMGSIAKITGIFLSALYCKVPFREALALGFMMNSKGLIELIILYIWKQYKVLDDQTFAITVVGVGLVSATTTPIIALLYRPSLRYMAYKRRTIEHSKRDAEFRILACAHQEGHVPAMISLLEASHPTKQSPISVFLLHLVQLGGRVFPMLFAHGEENESSSSDQKPSEHIVNAFKNYEEHNRGVVSVHPFTSIAPTESMHDDICTLAFNKHVSLILLPFHKQKQVDSTMGSANRVIQLVNRHVLHSAPCSVGVLINRGLSRGSTSSTLTNQISHNVAVLFLGGCDDREGLAYGMRMGENPNTGLTLVRFVIQEEMEEFNDREKKLNDEMVSSFRLKAAGSERILYQEEVVDNGEATINIIRSIRDAYDLFIVGKGQQTESPLTWGLTEWNEHPELGIIGDILSSSDFGGTVSVLVVQQHAKLRMSQVNPQPVLDMPLQDVENGLVLEKNV
ncbi:cation/H(+) antiporter 15-like [Tasmannia lanceolata]|uniref:cation/H(+) antiporter 15-like n=1 Tax=Tasmannia lanceolata TaxID=3420 RepID=UPI004062B927